jgi:hypothetical protein
MTNYQILLVLLAVHMAAKQKEKRRRVRRAMDLDL